MRVLPAEMCAYQACAQYLCRPEDGIRSPGIGVRDGLCINYFTIAVTKYQDQDNSWKEG